MAKLSKQGKIDIKSGFLQMMSVFGMRITHYESKKSKPTVSLMFMMMNLNKYETERDIRDFF